MVDFRLNFALERKRIWVSLLPPLGLYHLSVRFTFALRAHSSQNYLDAVEIKCIGQRRCKCALQ